MRAFLRKLRAKFTDEISSHIVRWVIAGLVTGASGYAFLFERPRTWLLASHTINGPGWLLLVVLALPVVSICVLGYLVIGSRLYKLWTYEDPVDVTGNRGSHLHISQSGTSPVFSPTFCLATQHP